ncbi:LINE-1 retrotransposable element ORF2 protein [Cucumis melo var. makuwa]|uniref:LINE-1 retrotransposable element ORF2 protein n=1 Tax=Cucumis melo var. makuwa TaxID=1194695 RepID=A0A5D3BVB5_CUCMM|nr:LINE-1 retrotransposable element ORF2 protein [Cucumis melo var. makuwa]
MHYARTLSRVASDHFPNVLETTNLKWGPAPFRFTNSLLKDIHFNKNLKVWWNNTSQSGHLGYAFMRRLKQLSNSIKNWQKIHNGNREEEKKAWIKEIDEIDNLEDENEMIDILRLHRISIKTDLNQFASQEAQTWTQRCERLWNLEGDENFAYFHKICSARQRRNFISSITSKRGEACTTNDKIEKAFLDHFEEIYRNNCEDLWLIDNLHWSIISNKEREDLCKPFTESEIQVAFKDFTNNKFSGLDGFTIEFFKAA